MKQVRVNMATGAGGIQAAMPSFVEVPGSYQGDPAVVTPFGVKAGVPLGDARLAAVTVLVEVPDDELAADGSIDKAKIRQKYPNHFLIQSGRFA